MKEGREGGRKEGRKGGRTGAGYIIDYPITVAALQNRPLTGRLSGFRKAPETRIHALLNTKATPDGPRSLGGRKKDGYTATAKRRGDCTERGTRINDVYLLCIIRNHILLLCPPSGILT